MKNFKHEGDICILEKSLTAVWGQSWREEKLELGSDYNGHIYAQVPAVAVEGKIGMENCIKRELTL